MEAMNRFGDAAPFLDQGRAQNTLRHELQTLFTAVESRMDAATSLDNDMLVELSVVPNRIIARRGAQALSFSWLGGRLGGVSDGKLLVIEWSGLAANQKGAAALKSATASREAAYHPEARDAATWCWRSGAVERACSTLDLVEEWFSGAALLHVAPALR